MIIAGAFLLQASSASEPSITEAAQSEVLKQIVEAARSARRGVVLVYSGECRWGDDYSMPLPSLPMESSTDGLKGVASIRALLLRAEQRVSIIETADVVEIRLGHPLETIFNTKISELRLDPFAQYNPALAINAVENSDDVKTALAHAKLHMPARTFNLFVTSPNQRLPHLPPNLRNVTVGYVLGIIAKQFRGAVLYGTCAHTGIIEITFTK